MRLFVALDIDEAIQQRLDDYVRTLQPRLPGVRFVRSNTYHVTLKFLGEVPTRTPCANACATFAPTGFEITLRGVGFFPNARAPRVFWAGISAPSAARARSQRRSVARGAGLSARAEFHPHLTLARNGSGRRRPVRGERPPEAFAQLPAIVASSPAPEFGTMTAREFFLYESRLSPSGPSYHKLEAFELA